MNVCFFFPSRTSKQGRQRLAPLLAKQESTQVCCIPLPPGLHRSAHPPPSAVHAQRNNFIRPRHTEDSLEVPAGTHRIKDRPRPRKPLTSGPPPHASSFPRLPLSFPLTLAPPMYKCYVYHLPKSHIPLSLRSNVACARAFQLPAVFRPPARCRSLAPSAQWQQTVRRLIKAPSHNPTEVPPACACRV